MSVYQPGDRVQMQVVKGQISINAEETKLEVRSAIGEIIRQIPLLQLEEDVLVQFPYLRQAAAYEVQVEGETVGAIGWPEIEGEDYNAADGLMYIAVMTRQIPLLIQGLASP